MSNHVVLSAVPDDPSAVVADLPPQAFEAVVTNPDTGGEISATVTRIGDIGEAVLVNNWRGQFTECDLAPKKGASEKDKRIWTDTQRDLQNTWNSAKAYAASKGGSNLVIDYDHIYISYETTDGDGNKLLHRVGETEMDPGLRELIGQVRKNAKQLWKRLSFASEMGGTANRSITANRPLEIQSDKWEKARPRTLDAFMDKDGWATRLYARLENPNRQNEAFAQILATERMLRSLQQSVRGIVSAKQQRLAAPALASAERKQLAQSLAELQKLEHELSDQEFKRDAVYTAVGVWGNTQTFDTATRFAKADETTTVLRTILSGELKPGEDDRSFLRKKVSRLFGSQEGELLEGLTPIVANYALDAGDLLLHTKFDYLDRLGGADRPEKAVSMEEFITHNMIHLQDENFNMDEALSSLGIHVDADTRAELVQAANQSREAAILTRDTAAGVAGPPWEAAYRQAKAQGAV